MIRRIIILLLLVVVAESKQQLRGNNNNNNRQLQQGERPERPERVREERPERERPEREERPDIGGPSERPERESPVRPPTDREPATHESVTKLIEEDGEISGTRESNARGSGETSEATSRGDEEGSNNSSGETIGSNENVAESGGDAQSSESKGDMGGGTSQETDENIASGDQVNDAGGGANAADSVGGPLGPLDGALAGGGGDYYEPNYYDTELTPNTQINSEPFQLPSPPKSRFADSAVTGMLSGPIGPSRNSGSSPFGGSGNRPAASGGSAVFGARLPGGGSGGW